MNVVQLQCSSQVIIKPGMRFADSLNVLVPAILSDSYNTSFNGVNRFVVHRTCLLTAGFVFILHFLNTISHVLLHCTSLLSDLLGVDNEQWDVTFGTSAIISRPHPSLSISESALPAAPTTSSSSVDSPLSAIHP